MTLTPARTDLPSVGAKIVVLHGGGQFYVGPHDVLAVDPEQQLVITHPEDWPEGFNIEYRQHEGRPPLEWNLLSDLTEAERASIAEWQERGRKKAAQMRERMRIPEGAR